MADLLSSTEKSEIESALQNVRDTFARNIIIRIKTRQPASWSQNPFYEKNNPTSSLPSQEELTSHTVSATILYKNDQNQELFDGGGQANLPSSEGQVRIKINSAANELIKNAEHVEIDGILYVLDSDAKVIGPFSAQAYMYYLKREN